MKAEKDEQKKKLSMINEESMTARKFAEAETLKTYELFCCFVVGKARTQWDKIVQGMNCKDPFTGQLHKNLCMYSWASFKDCIELHKLILFPADTIEK